MKPISQDLLYDYKFLSNLTYSPAKLRGVCVSTCNVEENGYDSISTHTGTALSGS